MKNRQPLCIVCMPGARPYIPAFSSSSSFSPASPLSRFSSFPCVSSTSLSSSCLSLSPLRSSFLSPGRLRCSSPVLSSASSLSSCQSSFPTPFFPSGEASASVLLFFCFSRHASSSSSSSSPSSGRKVPRPSNKQNSTQSRLLSVPEFLQKSKRFPPAQAHQQTFELAVKFEWLASATALTHKSSRGHSSSSSSSRPPVLSSSASASSPPSPSSPLSSLQPPPPEDLSDSSSSSSPCSSPSSFPPTSNLSSSSPSRRKRASPVSSCPPPLSSPPPSPVLPMPPELRRQWSRAVETAKSNVDLFSPGQLLSVLHSTASSGISIPSFSTALRRRALEIQDKIKNPSAFVRLLVDLDRMGGLKDRHLVLFRDKISSLLRSRQISVFGAALLLHLLSKHRLRDETLLHSATRRLILEETELTTAIRQTPAIIPMLLLSLAKLDPPRSCVEPLLNRLLDQQASARLRELSCQELLNLAYALVCLSTHSQVGRNVRDSMPALHQACTQDEKKEKETETKEGRGAWPMSNQSLVDESHEESGRRKEVRVKGDGGVHTPERSKALRTGGERIEYHGEVTREEAHNVNDSVDQREGHGHSNTSSEDRSTLGAETGINCIQNKKRVNPGLGSLPGSGIGTPEARQDPREDTQPHGPCHESGMQLSSASSSIPACHSDQSGGRLVKSGESSNQHTSLCTDYQRGLTVASSGSAIALAHPHVSSCSPFATNDSYLPGRSDAHLLVVPGVCTPSHVQDIACRSTLLTNTLRCLARSFFHPRVRRPILPCAWNQLKFVDAYITHNVGPLSVTDPEALALLARAGEMPLVKEVLISQVQKRVGRMLHEEGLIEDLSIEYPVGPFVLDFALPKQKLAVEIDGENHFFFGTNVPTSRTRFKREILAAMGWRVVVIPEELWKAKKKGKVRRFVVAKVKEALGVSLKSTVVKRQPAGAGKLGGSQSKIFPAGMEGRARSRKAHRTPRP